MKYYKSTDNQIFIYEDDVIAPPEYTPITAAVAKSTLLATAKKRLLEEIKTVPYTISRFQMMAILMVTKSSEGKTLYEIIDDHLKNQIGENEAAILLKTAWDTLPDFDRDSAIVKTVQQVLNLSDGFVDDIFRKAHVLAM